MRPLTRLSLSFLLCAVAACGGKQGEIDIPLNEARSLNSDISAAYVRSRDLLEDAAREARRMGTVPESIDPNDMDVDLTRQVLEACFTQSLARTADANLGPVPARVTGDVGPEHAPLTSRPDLGRIRACNPARMIALEAHLAVVDAEIQTFLRERVLEVDALRVNLKDVLVAQLDDLERTVLDANAEVARLRELSETRHANAQNNDKVDPEDRRRNHIDYETIIRELEQIDDVLEQVQAEFDGMRRLRRQLVDQTAQSIAAFGVAD